MMVTFRAGVERFSQWENRLCRFGLSHGKRINTRGERVQTLKAKLNDWRNRRFVRDIAWNLLGQGAPMLAALFAIPILVKHLGTDRFGLLTIGWMLIGYFGLLDLGIGRALTQSIARQRAAGERGDISASIWGGIAAMLLLGLIAAGALAAAGGWIAGAALKIPAQLIEESRASFNLLALAIPSVLLASGLRGILEAVHEFKAINLVRLPLGVLTFVAPLLALPYGPRLDNVFLSLLFVRLATALAFLCLCHALVPEFRTLRFQAKALRELLRFGGWMTVSSIVSPVMVQMDRFLIGATMSVRAVAFYATPYEMVTKLLIVPGAIAAVCFPAAAGVMASGAYGEARKLYEHSCKSAFFLVLPFAAVLAVFADDILRLWLGAAFAAHSAVVLQLLSLGVLINGVGQIPFAFLQGAGRSDTTAKLHLCELALYLPVLWAAVSAFGIAGAAAAWTMRVLADTLALHVMTRKLIAEG